MLKRVIDFYDSLFDFARTEYKESGQDENVVRDIKVKTTVYLLQEKWKVLERMVIK